MITLVLATVCAGGLIVAGLTGLLTTPADRLLRVMGVSFILLAEVLWVAVVVQARGGW